MRISIRDAAVAAQIVMLGFERRQYKAAIDRELNEIQMDAERVDARPDIYSGR